MPLSLDNSGATPIIRIYGVTPPEEGDELLTLLRENGGAAVDLSELEHLHTALLQILVAAKLQVIGWPTDEFWRLCLHTNMEENI